MNSMWNYLSDGSPLPPSQVVRTTARGPSADPLICAPPLMATNIPPISVNPVAADRITFDGNTLVIPD
jgi:hydroxybutyrate-dimer hydrolase